MMKKKSVDPWLLYDILRGLKDICAKSLGSLHQNERLFSLMSCHSFSQNLFLWILTHPDLARSARVNAFVEHFTEALASP